MITATMRIAYAQVDSFLSLLEQKYVEMVPRNIRFFFKQEMDTTYDKPLVADVPMKHQNLTDEALALIAYLNLNYWCQDEDEKEAIRKKFKEDEERYNENIKTNQHGADDIFRKDNEEVKEFQEVDESNLEKIAVEEKSSDLVEYKKENIFSKIWNKIKSKFIK